MCISKLSKSKLTTILKLEFCLDKKGRKPKIPYWRILKLILYRLKTGCQWRELPIKECCGKVLITWNTVYYYFKKWAKEEVWKRIWLKLLAKHKASLDLSTAQLDGSHTPARQRGEATGYQGRKKAWTRNRLFLTDNRGQILAFSPAIPGNHHDTYELEKMLPTIFEQLRQAGISTDGIFLNADAGFDDKKMRQICTKWGIIPNIDHNRRNSQTLDYQHFKDEELYKRRFVVEQANAWMDAYKMLLVSFEKLTFTADAFVYLACMLRFVT